MTVFARYLSSSDNFAPAAGRMNNKSAENPANVIIRPANVYKRVAPLISMFCSRILCELPLQRTAVHQIPWQKSPQIIWKVTHTAYCLQPTLWHFARRDASDDLEGQPARSGRAPRVQRP